MAGRKRTMAGTERTTTEIERIPADLIEEILRLLPSNDLLNFKRVCKNWYQLISSLRFFQKHLRRSDATLILTLLPYGMLIHDDPTGNKIDRRRRISYSDGPIRKKIGRKRRQIGRCIPYPPRFSTDNMRIAGSCDGLVCLIGGNRKEFAIINARTGKFVIGATDGFVFDKGQVFWFGHHPSTGEYLIVGTPVKRSNMINVYRFSSMLVLSSLQHCSTWDSCSHDRSPILLHGALHWSAVFKSKIDGGRGVVVLAYDIGRNNVLEFPSPFKGISTVRIGIVDGCLFAIVYIFNFELWIMKEYGMAESWTKYGSLRGFDWCLDVYPLGFLPDGDVVLEFHNGMLVKYKFSDMKGTLLDVYGEEDCEYVKANTAVFCADSLVTPAAVWGEGESLFR